MKKSDIISDIKGLIREAKSIKQSQRTFGMFDAYDKVLECIQNQGKPKRMLPSRELGVVKDYTKQEPVRNNFVVDGLIDGKYMDE